MNGNVDLVNDEVRSVKSETVDLTDNSLLVDISDALSERDKVKFTVHTKTSLPEYAKPEFSVIRQHEEFVWLHQRYLEDETYAGFLIPPPPPRPDFDASREKLQRLSEGEGTMTKEEFNRMKQELEAEYLATFKKTVAMHELFLSRLAAHPVFRNNQNFKIFLEYEQDLSVRGKNKKEKLEDFVRSLSRTTDELLLSSTQKEIDEFFERQKNFLVGYHVVVNDTAGKSDRMASAHRNVADTLMAISIGLSNLSTMDPVPDLQRFLMTVADFFEKERKIEARVASDEDLKVTDLLKYYKRDTNAAKELLYRRLRCLANYEAANKALDKARTRNKEVQLCELSQQRACEKFETVSERGKEELEDFRARRVAAFRRHLIEVSELEIKHAKAHVQLLKATLESLKGAPTSS
ncbi:unnamed protein product [Cyprideis torosa]|uniref:Sorting nexin n=1 Tax=Cyprideis torosa TaxID=163714 RepID=A0A7R8WIQ1_9CRUS|nr:unnamed protein product [Cyprideis torosa]CAG0898199.1 unnamed protein product [Cyprideis torosa]